MEGQSCSTSGVVTVLRGGTTRCAVIFFFISISHYSIYCYITSHPFVYLDQKIIVILCLKLQQKQKLPKSCSGAEQGANGKK